MSSRTPLPSRLLLPVLFASLGLAVFARAQAPPGGAPAAAPPRPELKAFAGMDGRWAWIKDTGGQSELFVGDPSGAVRLRAKGSGWTEAALDGSTIWLLGRTGPGGTLLSLPLEGDAPPTEAVRLPEPPGALWAQGGQVFWLELAPAADPGLAFVPPLGARLRVQCREPGGGVRTVLERPALEGVDPGAEDIVGLADGRLYLRLRSTAGTELISTPLQGDTPTPIAGESRTQQARLFNGVLYWTAPSDEATPESGIRCLRRLGASGRPETVADWLPGLGSLLVADEGLRYADEGSLYRFPDRFGTPTFLRKIATGRIVSDGHTLVVLGADQPRTLSSAPLP